MRQTNGSQARSLIWLSAGFVVWSIAFVAMYALLSLGCALGWDGIEIVGPVDLQRVSLAGLYALTCLAGAAVAMAAWQRRTGRDHPGTDRPLTGAAAWAAIAALVANIVTLGPVLFLTSCV